MPVYIVCPNPECQGRIVLPETYTAKRAKCPRCGHIFALPASANGGVKAPPPPPPQKTAPPKPAPSKSVAPSFFDEDELEPAEPLAAPSSACPSSPVGSSPAAGSRR